MNRLKQTILGVSMAVPGALGFTHAVGVVERSDDNIPTYESGQYASNPITAEHVGLTGIGLVEAIGSFALVAYGLKLTIEANTSDRRKSPR